MLQNQFLIVITLNKKTNLKNIKKNIEINLRNHEFHFSSFRSINFIFLIFVIVLLGTGCNLCPTSPDGNNGSTKTKIYSTLIPLNSTTPIITEINLDDYSFNSIEENGYLFSPPAQNGNFTFIRINQDETKKYLMMGNLLNRTVYIIEKESQDFSIFNPTISKSGNQVAFLGGSNQLFLWVQNPTNNSSYIDKISGKVLNNILPAFSPDGTYLSFLEKIDENTISVKVINALNTDQIIYTKEFKVNEIPVGIDNYLTFSSNNKISFLIQDEVDDKIVVIDFKQDKAQEFPVSRKKLGIKIAKISPDGNYLAVTANDGNIWLIKLSENELMFNQITNEAFCNSFIYFDWNSNGDKLLAQSYNCNDDVTKGSTLYLINFKKENDELNFKSKQMICNNIQRAFWSN
jgi:hypothetical protein